MNYNHNFGWMSFLDFIFNRNKLPVSDKYFNEIWGDDTFYSPLNSNHLRLKKVFSNPALLKVISLQCDLFSLGKIYVYKDGKEVEKDPFLNMIKNPNPFQNTQQFLWDYMFWNMLGNAYCYVDSKIVDENNKLYFLSPDKITWPDYLNKMKDRLVLSKSTLNNIMEQNITYNYSDGTPSNFKYRNIINVPDLTNGSGNWFEGKSRIDSLFKVIENSEAGLDSKNINVRYAGKFLVAGKSDPDNITQEPLSDTEKTDIETKVNGRKSVHAVKSMIDIKRFVEDIGALKLDESYLADYFIIGSMYGIPRDVLEAYRSSTYENQEKARGAHVSYCLQPKGNQFFSAFEKMFDYTDKEIVIDWEHLPFMQVFAKERAETNSKTAETFIKLLDAGVSLDEINEFLDTKFTTGNAQERKNKTA